MPRRRTRGQKSIHDPASRSDKRPGPKSGSSDAVKQQDYLIYGMHAVQTLIDTQPERILQVRTTNADRLQPVLHQLRKLGLPVIDTDREALSQLAGVDHHQGVVATCKPKRMLNEEQAFALLVKSGPLTVLVLDGLQDPHNLGACLRSADATGVDLVIVPEHRAVGLTATVAKVAAGAMESVPVAQVTNIARALAQLKSMGFWIAGTSDKASASLFEYEFDPRTVLVMGAEGKGLRPLIEQHCDQLISIPMQGIVSSLNVSVATGICLYERKRQQLNAQ